MLFVTHAYKLREAIVAVHGVPEGGMRLITIPAGSVLQLPDGHHRFGIPEVLWEDQKVGVFLQDVKKRADLVDAASS